MDRYFVDSNIFLRFYNADEPEQKNAAREVFLKAKRGEIELICGPPVFFEVAWVLRSRYKIPNPTVIDTLESMLALPGLYILDDGFVKTALEFARKKKQSYSDAYIAVTAKEHGAGFVSFNTRHFARLGAKMYPFGI